MRKTLLNTMGLLLALFGATNASAQSTVELPYSITFDSTNDVWTVIDASPSPGTSWVFNNDWGNDGCLRYAVCFGDGDCVDEFSRT